jgi:hypothetical protein
MGKSSDAEERWTCGKPNDNPRREDCGKGPVRPHHKLQLSLATLIVNTLKHHLGMSKAI